MRCLVAPLLAESVWTSPFLDTGQRGGDLTFEGLLTRKNTVRFSVWARGLLIHPFTTGPVVAPDAS